VDAGAAARARMLREVMNGLTRAQEEIPSKYFYDARGSELFEAITELPEYYPTRCERALLERWIPSWASALRPAALVELGAGSASKTRVLLDALEPGALYVPLDVSESFLLDTAERLRAEYEELAIEPQVGDFTRSLELPVDLPSPALFAFLGSTLGNFAPGAAVRLLARVRACMRSEDRFLLGLDLRPAGAKTVERLERAYDDALGVTAEFNLNVLRVLNEALGSDFDPSAFRHHAFYNEHDACIEMHLVSLKTQEVDVPGGGSVSLAEGESVRTEISCKYDRGSVDAMVEPADLEVHRWQPDDDGLYTLVLLAPK
jgi:L-histidine N-alpha-methyltransferase